MWYINHEIYHKNEGDTLTCVQSLNSVKLVLTLKNGKRFPRELETVLPSRC